MSTEDRVSDDYVAELLKKDAKDTNVKYSALGLQAFVPKRPTTNAPKPNTRFLRNIIRDTDNHNAALLAKEAEDSRQRLRALVGAGARSKQNHSKTSTSLPNQDERRSKHRKLDVGDDDNQYKLQRSRSGLDRSPKRSDRASRKERRHRDEEVDSLSDVTIVEVGQGGDTRRRKKVIVVVEDVRYQRSRPPPDRETESTSLHQGPHDASDSDPLESIIGPPPPPPQPKVSSRGRGTFASSGIDDRFSSSYNPTTDVHPNSESEDDWDQALEALRDRQRWKQQGADRLRSAGFSEDEVKKWERGGEKREEDVRWTTRGEDREWDRGKVIDDQGDVGLRPEWGRLKGT
ncbi:MAG: hypothetical protein M1837_000780 [Sclerophora amabilis]|nr:MAG: hypothetical protein M1837_000780 [Sclerophora amabilis]